MFQIVKILGKQRAAETAVVNKKSCKVVRRVQCVTCTLHSVKCVWSLCNVRLVHFTVCSVQCAMCNVQCAVHSVCGSGSPETVLTGNPGDFTSSHLGFNLAQGEHWFQLCRCEIELVGRICTSFHLVETLLWKTPPEGDAHEPAPAPGSQIWTLPSWSPAWFSHPFTWLRKKDDPVLVMVKHSKLHSIQLGNMDQTGGSPFFGNARILRFGERPPLPYSFWSWSSGRGAWCQFFRWFLGF